MLKKIYDRLSAHVHSKYATPFLGFLFFIEALFFIPVDPILMMYCLENRRKAMLYAAVATVCSVLGGMAGYGIGYWLWEFAGEQILDFKYVAYIVPRPMFEYLCQQYRTYEAVAIMIAGFSPIPYKAATLSAGFCKLNFIPFVVYSFISRGARFFLVAGLISLWGAHIKYYIDHYFNLLVVLFILLTGAAIWVIT